MEVHEVYKYPELIVNSTIKDQLSVIRRLSKQLDNEKQKLNQLVFLAQKDCRHSFKKIMEFDKDYIHGLDKDLDMIIGDVIYKGKECVNCGEFVPRSEGAHYVICHKCGNHMGSSHILPAVRGSGNRYLYICPTCGHSTFKK